MRTTSVSSAVTRTGLLGALAATACSLTLLGGSQAAAQTGVPTPPPSAPVTAPPPASATLEQCLTASAQAERSVTFAGEMTAIPGTVRMAMRFDVEERAAGEVAFHTVSAPGLGVWRASDAKVKTYRYLKQVTNLSSPAVYRALVHFRWSNAKGHPIKHADRLTPRCAQLTATPPISPTLSEGLSASEPASAHVG